MKRNCDFKLGLSSPRYRQCHPQLRMKNSGNNQLLTLFCNGKVVVFDVTEFQARAIILLASREMEGRSNTKPDAREEEEDGFGSNKGLYEGFFKTAQFSSSSKELRYCGSPSSPSPPPSSAEE
ncbi:unnamed protein product [Fraxinus pennsylvanica]|uniref:Tify domain-containing protein n=1 Tax=Fraxinus pennsylvanica TaxID=56036 RepID=A0AAD2DKZ8_9LAMI|nr:unnamed protein product [Fraxinus pennsylvanica]